MEKLSISKFWRKKSQYYNLVGKRCKKCGYVFYPPKHVCPKCNSSDLEDYFPPETGTLISFTKLYETPNTYKSQKPIYLGIIKFGEINVLTQIVDVQNEDELKPGITVERVFRKINEDGNYGLIYYGIKVRPVV
ncbi:Zn-ribbon domain-containing OB-fold protein [Fervidicoccus fontis]|jgi:uncharacterized OB-fold protein|uniref:Zn-ribbon domain-containing OB-fold protein n=2 Tax=Fervidicoccus fontis TaxID=683846 RepID=I0A004_FERFK|nr:Zn-ribbon domain-containing OB-fold protein [Fervidicoccus fontis]AFH42311.1 hypothetical protein FFONT_0321 [Fervidicoccus fontis Kam940]MBE9391761.1 Zn-ribbon domain-containing OB-fold protein [Fervidicoccus fontis]